MNRPIEQQYINEITKGMWIVPRKRREARLELRDHLEDVKEARGFREWDQEKLDENLGNKSKLKKKFSKEGVPMWAKLLKWGLRLFLAVMAIIIVMNFYFLWFYEVDSISMKYVNHGHPYVKHLFQMGIPVAERRWIDEAEPGAGETYERLITSLETWKAYKKRTSKNVAVGFPTREQDPNFTPPDMTEKEFDTLWTNWVDIKERDVLAFPKPTVTDEDVEKMQQLIEHPEWAKGPQMRKELKKYQRYLYIREYPEIPIRERLYAAKTLRMMSDHFLTMQTLYKGFPRCVPAEKRPRVLAANALWLKKYMDAINPKPEPLIEVLVLIAMAGINQHQMKEEINIINNVEPYDDALRSFSEIAFDKMVDSWLKPDDLQDLKSEWGAVDQVSTMFGVLPPFRWQCSIMQWFHSEDTRAYRRYEVLKQGMQRMFQKIGMPNLSNAYTRLQTINGKQALAEGVLQLHRHGKIRSTITDPFTNKPIRVIQENSRHILESAGPDRQFDDAVYHPSNGTVSRGDLVWEVKNRGL
ncbi:hypothetical protein GF373_13810 [bacterium]|nr:hypothetical protein [bacterium]